MMTVGEILKQKTTREVYLIGPKDSVYEALRLMAIHNLGALMVVEGDHLLGVISERDYARNIILKERSSKTTKVCEVLSGEIVYVDPSSTVDHCMSLILNKYVRHLPVLEHGKLVGVVSVGDVVKVILGEKDHLIDELVRYITDSPLVMAEQTRNGGSSGNLSHRLMATVAI